MEQPKTENATLQEIASTIKRIERILLQFPEVAAATFFTMKDEYEAAKLRGKTAKDIWEIIPPNSTQNQFAASGAKDRLSSEKEAGN